jgi:hypothetical protein
MDYSANIKRV